MIASPADLTYFVEVANTLNVSRAAERLGISQPSLTLAMQRLEQSVGTSLLTRSRRGVNLTPAGKQVLAHARHLLQSWDDVKAQALSSVHDIQGAYTIGCHASVALYLLSRFLPGLMEKHPELNIKLRHDLSRKIAEEVVSMKIDVGVVVNPIQHPDLIIHRLCTDEMTLWTAAQAPRRNKSILICDPGLLQAQALLKKLKKSGMIFDRMIYSDNLEVIADLTANGCGIGILPAKVAHRSRKKLERLPKAPVFYDEHCLIFRVENKGIKSVQTINQAIRHLFESERM
ncbi:MAG: LysR family transcriptional regulator [Proteobacteria bacterium]|nr:LysR family transcriptional regulator [Pseudomonadota bacterium]